MRPTETRVSGQRTVALFGGAREGESHFSASLRGPAKEVWFQERRLQHREEVGKIYRDLAAQRMKVRVGMEASGQAQWFERLLGELQFELWKAIPTIKGEEVNSWQAWVDGHLRRILVEYGTSV
jgi:hypothetical protein